MKFNRKKILATVFSLALFFALLEIGIRLSGKYATLSEKNGDGFLSFFAVNHPGIINSHIANRDIHISNPDFSYVHNIDSLGFRNNSSDTNKLYPILTIGDSFTEGLGAPQDSTWPALLEDFVGEGVYNAGIMGSDPVYGYKLLTENILPFQPKQVIFAVNFSDIADILIRGGGERFSPDGHVHYREEPWFLPLYHRSYLFRAVLHLVFGYDYMFNSPQNREQNMQQGLDILAKSLTQANDWCAEKKIKMKVYVHPLPQEYYMNLDRRLDFGTIDKLVPMLNALGVDAVNLRPGFELKLHTPQDWKAVSWPLDGHFNSKGYKMMAQLIAEDMRDSSKVY